MRSPSLTRRSRTVNGRIVSDYTWRGNVIVRNSRWEPFTIGTFLPFLYGSYSGKHNFGYECYMPTVIDIDGLYVKDIPFGLIPVYMLGDITPDNTNSSFHYTYPYHITETLRIKNYSSRSGHKWKLSSNSYMYRNVHVEE